MSRARTAIVISFLISFLAVPGSSGAGQETLGPPFDGSEVERGCQGELYDALDYCSASVEADHATGAIDISSRQSSPDDGRLPGLGDWVLADAMLFVEGEVPAGQRMRKVEVVIEVASALAEVDATASPVDESFAAIYAMVRPCERCGLQTLGILAEQTELGAVAISDEVFIFDADVSVLSGPYRMEIGVWSDNLLEVGAAGEVAVDLEATVASVTATIS